MTLSLLCYCVVSVAVLLVQYSFAEPTNATNATITTTVKPTSAEPFTGTTQAGAMVSDNRPIASFA